jgi:hypothetical protein
MYDNKLHVLYRVLSSFAWIPSLLAGCRGVLWMFLHSKHVPERILFDCTYKRGTT